MLEWFCVNRKAKAFCVLPWLYIPPRKIFSQFHRWKMEFSVINLSLLNFPVMFCSAFLKGLSKSCSCFKQDPNLALYFGVGFSPLSALSASFWVWKLKYPHWFSTLFPKIYSGLYCCLVLNLQLSQSAHVGITALSHCNLPQLKAQPWMLRVRNLCIFH